MSANTQTAMAEEDPILNLLNKSTKQHFDLCLPIKKHINDIITDPKVTTRPMACTQFMGIAKDGCTNSNDTYEYCKDPRYLSWLANDYDAYPPGTWDFTDIGGYTVHPR